MRKLIILSLLAAALASCSNVAKYKEAIETLSADWEATTSKVSATVSQITEAQDQAKTALQAISPSEEASASLTEDQSMKIGELQGVLQEQMGNLGQLAQKAFEFVNQWQEGSEKLEDLKTGLAEGKLPADAQSTIDNLKEMVTTAGEEVKGWESEVNTAKEAIKKVTDTYNELIGSSMDKADM